MSRLSQKDLLNEGFGSMLRKGIGGAAKGIAAVGGALNQVSKAGKTADVFDVFKGAKAGYEAEKTRQGDPRTKGTLEKAVEDHGFIFKKLLKKGNDVYTVQVADIIWDDTTDPPTETEKVLTVPLKLKWDKQKKTFTRIGRGPRGITTVTSSYSQKDLLRQLTLLCD